MSTVVVCASADIGRDCFQTAGLARQLRTGEVGGAPVQHASPNRTSYIVLVKAIDCVADADAGCRRVSRTG